jgi:small ligand-binding sensory domain FIST
METGLDTGVVLGRHKPVARAAIAEDTQWDRALGQVLAQTNDIVADVAVLFASGTFARHFREMVRQTQRETGASVLIGCSGQGIIGPARELEDVPAVSLLALALPGARLRAVRFTQEIVEACESPHEWRDHTGVPLEDVNAWLVFADPFRMDCDRLVAGLAGAYPDRPMLGGLASADPGLDRTFVFLNGDVFAEGGVGLAVGGPYTILPLVSQGCEPIGEPWTITSVYRNVIESISNRPAYEMLVETFENLPPDIQERAQGNILVGLAADEYRETFARGSFLIRNIVGVDRLSGALAISALPRVGQTIQFQIRDAATADQDLRALLDQAREKLAGRTPIAAVLCSCNGRGIGMFGRPDHDAGAVAERLGAVPLAGLFCNGEIGPIGSRPFLHGFTASLALLVQEQDRV